MVDTNRGLRFARIQELYPITLNKARKEEVLSILRDRFGFVNMQLMTMQQLDLFIAILEELNAAWERGPIKLVHVSSGESVHLPRERVLSAAGAIHNLARVHKRLEQFHEYVEYRNMANELLALAGEPTELEIA